LGERLNGIQEVDGSIPFSSTITVAYAAPEDLRLRRTGSRLAQKGSTANLILRLRSGSRNASRFAR
jgi:hypothetical protein